MKDGVDSSAVASLSAALGGPHIFARYRQFRQPFQKTISIFLPVGASRKRIRVGAITFLWIALEVALRANFSEYGGLPTKGVTALSFRNRVMALAVGKSWPTGWGNCQPDRRALGNMYSRSMNLQVRVAAALALL